VSTDASADVRVVGPDQRDANTGQTPGLRRFEAISSKLTNSQRMWMGYAVLEPGGKTGVHHHGDSETAIYLVTGLTVPPRRCWIPAPGPSRRLPSGQLPGAVLPFAGASAGLVTSAMPCQHQNAQRAGVTEVRPAPAAGSHLVLAVRSRRRLPAGARCRQGRPGRGDHRDERERRPMNDTATRICCTWLRQGFR